MRLQHHTVVVAHDDPHVQATFDVICPAVVWIDEESSGVIDAAGSLHVGLVEFRPEEGDLSRVGSDCIVVQGLPERFSDRL